LDSFTTFAGLAAGFDAERRAFGLLTVRRGAGLAAARPLTLLAALRLAALRLAALRLAEPRVDRGAEPFRAVAFFFPELTERGEAPRRCFAKLLPPGQGAYPGGQK
jgi:hypothetical protein